MLSTNTFTVNESTNRKCTDSKHVSVVLPGIGSAVGLENMSLHIINKLSPKKNNNIR